MLVPYEHRFATVGQIFCEGSIARILGEFAAAAGRLDDAVAHLERGVSRDRTMGNVRSVLYGQSELATTLLRRNRDDDRERAAALADEAREQANTLGLRSITRALQGPFQTQ
jgi:hypothetical protein